MYSQTVSVYVCVCVHVCVCVRVQVMVLQQDFEGGWSADNFGKIEEKPCLEQSRSV